MVTHDSAFRDGQRTPGGVPAFELSPARLAAVAARHRWLTYRLVLVITTLTLGLSLLMPRSWTVGVSFIPQSQESGGMGDLTGLAAQFGVAVPVGGGGTSPDFYVEVLYSRAILERLLEEPLAGRGDSIVRTLLVGNDRSARATAQALQELRNIVATSVQPTTGSVRIDVTTDYADLSLTIARRLLTLLEDFNIATRRSQASAERVFTEQRLTEAKASLVAAEDALQAFIAANRGFDSAPRLANAHQRLNREVLQRQQLVLTLGDALEKARIEEVRDTPVITIVEPPALPLAPDGRMLLIKLLLALTASFAVAAVLAFGREYAAAAEELPSSSEQSLGDALRHDVKHPIETVRTIVFGSAGQ